VHVRSVMLKVRKKVTSANVPVAVAGFVMLGVGFVGGIIKGFKTGKRRKRLGK